MIYSTLEFVSNKVELFASKKRLIYLLFMSSKEIIEVLKMPSFIVEHVSDK